MTLEFTGPLAVAVIGSRRAQDFLSVLLAGTGILLITPWAGSHNVNGGGVLFALLAGVGWAAYIVLGGRVSRLFEGGKGAVNEVNRFLAYSKSRSSAKPCRTSFRIRSPMAKGFDPSKLSSFSV